MYRKFLRIIKNNSEKAQMVLGLSLNDYKQKYAGSALGIVWGFVPSLITVLVYWFVFTIGFRMNDSSEPYLLWLLSGLIPWFFFSEALLNVTNCFTEYSYLVKKVVFDINMLPYVKLCSSFINHIFFLVIMFYALLAYGYSPTYSTLQIFYYIICLMVFSVAIGKITATLNVLFRDVSNIASVVLQFGIWMLPILWKSDMFSSGIVNLLKLNPMFYIVLGYRASLLSSSLPENYILYSIYFWIVTGVLLWCGNSLLKKLRGQFADLL